MTVPSRFRLPLLLVLGLLQPQLACTGGGGGATTQPAPSPDFTLSLAAGNLNVTTGYSASLTVTASRSNGQSAAIILSVDGLPSGISAAGSIASGANSGSLIFSSTSGVAPQTLQGLAVKGTDGVLSRSASASLTLTVLPAQDGTGSGTNLVHASGGMQSNQSTQNAAVAGEPYSVAHTTGGTTENRPGFTPPLSH